MATKQDPLTPAIIIILLIITAALAYWFGFAAKQFKVDKEKMMIEEEQQIDSQSDLNEARDELEAVDPNAADTGLNELQVEISQY